MSSIILYYIITGQIYSNVYNYQMQKLQYIFVIFKLMLSFLLTAIQKHKQPMFTNQRSINSPAKQHQLQKRENNNNKKYVVYFVDYYILCI